MQQPLPETALRRSGAYTFFATREYLAQLTADITHTKAGDRVLLATMDFEPTAFGIEAVADACIQAVQRKVAVTLSLDAHSFIMDPHGHLGPLFYGTMQGPTKNKWFRAMYDGIEKMRQAGVTIIMTNVPKRPFMPPFSGRSHIKASIINDTLYIGGHNLDIPLLDCMVRFTDAQTADWLYALLMQRREHPHTQTVWGQSDLSHAIDQQTTLLVDVGKPHQSLIYQQALTLIDEAADWLVITCQFFPHSVTAKHLRAAQRRGVHVYPIFNSPRSHPPGIGRMTQAGVNFRERLRMPKDFFAGELPHSSIYLHAKILASSTEAMIGSHNYIAEGVRFGTAEIALQRKDPHFAQQLVQTILHETGLADEPFYRRFTS